MIFAEGFRLRGLFLKGLFLFLCASFIPCSVHGAEVNLAWDPNAEPDLAGYRV